MLKKHIILFAAVLLLLGGSALAQDVSGEWEFTSEGRQGPQTQTIKIAQDGEKITITMAGRQGEITGEGTIKDNKIEWKITRTMRDMEMTSTYTGTVDGVAMSGKMESGMGERMRESEWTAKKK